MKNFKLFVFGVLALVVAAFSTSCDSKGKEQQDAHREISVEVMRKYIETCKEKGYKYLIVDYRSKAAYDAGHIPGSIWLMEGNAYNMDDDSFAKAVYEASGRDFNTYIFLVGTANAQMIMTMGGSVSSYGFGQLHSLCLLGGFDAWAKACPHEIE